MKLSLKRWLADSIGGHPLASLKPTILTKLELAKSSGYTENHQTTPNDAHAN